MNGEAVSKTGQAKGWRWGALAMFVERQNGHGRGADYSALEATQGQVDGFFSQLPYKCHQNRVASVGG